MMLFNFYPSHTFLFPPIFFSRHNHCSNRALSKKKQKLRAQMRAWLDAHTEDLYSIFFCLLWNEIKWNIRHSRETRFNNYDPKKKLRRRKIFEFLSIFWSSSDRFREIFLCNIGGEKKVRFHFYFFSDQRSFLFSSNAPAQHVISF